MIEKTTRLLDQKGPNRVKPLAVPMMISNMAAGNVSIAFGPVSYTHLGVLKSF